MLLITLFDMISIITTKFLLINVKINKILECTKRLFNTTF